MHAMPPIDSQAPPKSASRPIISGTFHLLFPHLEFFKSNQQNSNSDNIHNSQTIDLFSSYPLRKSTSETSSKKKSFLEGLGQVFEERKKEYLEKSKEKKQLARSRYITPLIKSLSEIIFTDDFINNTNFKAFFLCHSLIDNTETVWSSMRIMMYDGPIDDSQQYISDFTENKRRLLCSLLYWVEKYPSDFSSKITLDIRQSLNHFPIQRWYKKKNLYESALYENLSKETVNCLKTIIETLSVNRKRPKSRDRIPYLILTRNYSSSNEQIHGDSEKNKIKISNSTTAAIDQDFRAFTSLVAFDATTIAFQYTLLSIDRYNSIDPRDFIGKVHLQDPTLNQMKLSEQMSRWVASTILHPTLTLTQRKTMFIKWIDIALCMKTLRNYNALVEIVAGLSIDPLYRIQSILWSTTSNNILQSYNSLLDFVSPSNNFKILRSAISATDTKKKEIDCNTPSRDVSSYKVGTHGITRKDIKSSSSSSININLDNKNTTACKIPPIVQTVPSIPYFGLLFRDCTFIQDSPSHLIGGSPNIYRLERLYNVITQSLLHQNCQKIKPYNEINKVSAVYAVVTTTMSQIMSLPELEAMSYVIKPDSENIYTNTTNVKTKSTPEKSSQSISTPEKSSQSLDNKNKNTTNCSTPYVTEKTSMIHKRSPSVPVRSDIFRKNKNGTKEKENDIIEENTTKIE